MTLTQKSKIFVAGHRGLLGSAIARRLRAGGYTHLIERGREELDLTRQAEVQVFFDEEKPDAVFLAAAKVGGIQANDQYSGDFIRDNLLIQTMVIDAAYRSGVQKFIFLGSNCIYPKHAPQPIKEEHLLTGPLEPTNSAYAIAKIAGVEMCHAYAKQFGFDAVCLMPTNLYGPGDNFHLQNAHVLPALMHRAHLAKTAGDAHLDVWGSGAPIREFLHVDDAADAAVYALESIEGGASSLLNIGTGEEISIRALAEAVCETVGFQGELRFDASKPDGTPRKFSDTSRMRDAGWVAKISLKQGLAQTYEWFLQNMDRLRAA